MSSPEINQILEVDGHKWRVEAATMTDALNEIAHARCTGSVGSSTVIDERLVGGEARLVARVHRLDPDGNEVKPS